MADTISTRDVLAPFQTASALNELNDYFLLQANRASGGDGSQSAIRIPAALVKAYLMAGFEISVNDDGYLVIGGQVTEMRFISELAPKIVAQTRRSVAISPNVLNRWGRVPTLTITSLKPGPEGYANEYMLEFIPSSYTFSLNLPGGVEWEEEPEWEMGKIYQVSIVHNLALYAGWDVPSEPSGGDSSSDIGDDSSDTDSSDMDDSSDSSSSL